jgi:mannose-1-phosphate guanylyltransferase
MRGLILAAGYGTRLRPLTDIVPKCLVEINGRPLLDFWLENMYMMGVTEVMINLHHLSGLVLSYLESNRYPIKLTPVYEESLLGTGGTLLRNKEYFQNQPTLMVHGDNLSRFDGVKFINTYKTRPLGVEITMMTFRTTEPQNCGILEVDGDGLVINFFEKVKNPPSDLANGAAYILSPSIINYLESLNKEVIDFSTEVIPSYLGKINTFFNDDYHRDIGSIKSLTLARKEY